MKSSSDYEVIKEVLDGNNEAFSELVSRYKNLVFSVILRMINDSEEACDLSQEVFIRVYKNLDKYNPEFKFSTWIMRIATNLVIDYRRKKKEDTVNLEDVEYDLKTMESPESDYIEKEQGYELVNAINKLPDLYKMPIILFHIKHFSYQEISEILRIPLSKVKNRIFRGRSLLKGILLESRRQENGM